MLLGTYRSLRSIFLLSKEDSLLFTEHTLLKKGKYICGLLLLLSAVFTFPPRCGESSRGRHCTPNRERWLNRKLHSICREKTQKTSSIHLWPYSPFWAPASLRRCLYSSCLHLHIPTDLWCDPPDDVLPSCSWFSHWSCIMKFPIRNLFAIFSCSILTIWPSHPSLLILISSTIFRSSYKLRISPFHIGCQHPLSWIGP